MRKLHDTSYRRITGLMYDAFIFRMVKATECSSSTYFTFPYEVHRALDR